MGDCIWIIRAGTVWEISKWSEEVHAISIAFCWVGAKLIRELLADKKEISIRELDEKAKEQGISGRTMRDGRSRMKNELEYQVNEKQENSIRLKEWWVAESSKQMQIFIDTLSATCRLPVYEITKIDC